MGVVAEIMVDREKETAYIRTCMTGQCWAKSSANNAVRKVYTEWLAINAVRLGYNCQVANAAGSHCVPSCAFYLPPLKPHQMSPRHCPFPQLVLEVEFADREGLVSSKVEEFYWHPAFVGAGGTQVNEVWGLFIPPAAEHKYFEEEVMQALVPQALGPLVQAQPADFTARPGGLYLIVYSRTQPAALYHLSLGTSFSPPPYSVFATAPPVCVTSFLQTVING